MQHVFFTFFTIIFGRTPLTKLKKTFFVRVIIFPPNYYYFFGILEKGDLSEQKKNLAGKK